MNGSSLTSPNRPGFITDDTGATDGRYIYFDWEVDQGNIFVTDLQDPGSDN